MIYGIGNDICDVRRIRASLERHGERFAARVLAETELATWRSRSARWPERGVRFVATRFVVGADHRDPGKFALRAGHRHQAHARHPGHVFQDFLQVIQAGQHALPGG